MPATLYVNRYECPVCSNRWDDVWCAQCDDTCPKCGTRDVSPTDSEALDVKCNHSDCVDR